MVSVVNRLSETTEFSHLLNNSHGNHTARALYIWGPPGIGKTTLLKYFQSMCEAEHRPVAYLDLQAIGASPHPAVDMAALVDSQLRRRWGSRLAWRKFRHKLRKWQAMQVRSEERSRTELRRLARTAVQQFGATGGVIGGVVAGPIGAAVGTSLGSALGSALDTGLIPTPFLLEASSPRPVTLAPDFERKMLADFSRAINRSKSVLLLDALEAVNDASRLEAWLVDELVLSVDASALVVLASHHAPGSVAIRGAQYLQEIRVGPLNREASAQLARHWLVGDQLSIDAIYERTRGLPFMVASLSRAVSASGPSVLSDSATTSEKLYLDALYGAIGTVESARSLRAATALRQFDEELLSGVSGEEAAAAIRALIDNSLATRLPDGSIAVEELVRSIVLRELRLERPGEYRDLNARAARLFESRLVKAGLPGATGERWARERIYHLFEGGVETATTEMAAFFDLLFSTRRMDALRAALGDLGRQALPHEARHWLDYYSAALHLKTDGAFVAGAAVMRLADIVDLPASLRARVRLLVSEKLGEFDGRWDLARESALAAIDSANAAHRIDLRAAGYEMAGRASLALDEPTDALRYLNADRLDTESLGLIAVRQKGRALTFLGVAYLLLRRFEDAFEAFNQAGTILLELKDDYALAVLYGDMAAAYVQQNDLRAARQYAEASARRASAAGEPMMIALSHLRLGDSALASGNENQASRHYERALSTFRRLRNSGFEAMALAAQANLASQSGDTTTFEAAAMAVRRIARHDRAAVKFHLRLSLLGGARALNTGDIVSAATYYSEAAAMATSPASEHEVMIEIRRGFLELGRAEQLENLRYLAHAFASQALPPTVAKYTQTVAELSQNEQDVRLLTSKVAEINQ